MQLDRRQFLKLAGVTGALAIPAVLGYDLVHDAHGELPSSLSPYAPADVLESWPSDPEAASPVLLLINEGADNPFGLYLGEILRAEGLNCFQIARLSDIDSAPLHWYDVVLLAQGPLSTSQAERLEAYVANGGRLVAMRPGVRLAPLLGVEPLGASTSESYVQVDPGHPAAQGIASRALQYHGTADHYRLAGARAVAWLAGANDLPTVLPAVTLHRYGGGQAALWAFDLARSVALTRQGNPAWADQERDGGDGIRAPDMFKGWIDLDRMHIPQADEQQRLLVNLLVALSEQKRPLPRLWYSPVDASHMLIATGDCHTNPASAIEQLLGLVEQYNGHISIYYAPPRENDFMRAARKVRFWGSEVPYVGEPLSERFKGARPSQVADWRARGHEFGLHPYVEEGLEASWFRDWQAFTGLGFGPVPRTVRTHRILWTGWVETARVQASYGMGMNMDYYHWGPAFQKANGEWAHGHLTGSGLPMRFVDEQGRVLNIYQQLTQIADDHLLNLAWGGVEKIDAEAAVEVSRAMLRSGPADPFTAIVAHFHVDPFWFGAESTAQATRWLNGTLDYAVAQGVPIWSAQEWLHFTEVRHDANLRDVEWSPANGRLSFRLSAHSDPSVMLNVMVPLSHGDAHLAQLAVDGGSLLYRERQVGGVDYGWVSVPAGPHRIEAIYA